MIDTRDVVQKLVPPYCQGRVLDIGGGTAKYRALIEPHCDSYETADLYESADHKEDVRNMSFTDESFDAVLSFQVLEHVDDTRAAASEMLRILKKGGYLILTAPFMGARHGDPSDFHRFTPEGLAFYFKGHRIVRIGTQGSTLSVLSEMMRYHFLNPYAAHPPRRIIVRLCNWLKALDRRGYFTNKDLFTNSYIVVQKS